MRLCSRRGVLCVTRTFAGRSVRRCLGVGLGARGRESGRSRLGRGSGDRGLGVWVQRVLRDGLVEKEARALAVEEERGEARRRRQSWRV